LIAAAATYGAGEVARPVGAFMLGNLGDRFGRRNILIAAMLMMGISTFLVGILPTYHQVGLLAPALLVVLRLIQGFAVAGELSGASAMIIEHAPDNQRGFYASFSLQGTQVGRILGTAVFIPLSGLLSDAAFQSWGWRVPFLLSAVVIVAALVIRAKVHESELFLQQAQQRNEERSSVWQVFRENGTTVVRAVCMGLANVIGTTVVIFGTAYATQESYGIGMAASTYLWMPVVANIVAVILIPFFGRLADRICRRPLMIFGPRSAVVLTFPDLWAVQEKNVVLTVLLAVLMFGVLYQIWNATFASFFQEIFPLRNRMTGFALSQNIALFLVAMLPSLFTSSHRPTPPRCTWSSDLSPSGSRRSRRLRHGCPRRPPGPRRRRWTTSSTDRPITPARPLRAAPGAAQPRPVRPHPPRVHALSRGGR